ncbi:MAG: beta-ketoacyl-ACP synthase II [Thermoleophilia bacterium]
MSERRVVVTGMGVVSACGIGLDAYWGSLKAGKSGVARITHFDSTDFRVHIAAEVKDFDPTVWIDKKRARRMDLFSQYAVAAARMAIEDAQLDVAADSDNIGALVASGIGGLETFERETANLLYKGPGRVSPLFIPMEISNMASAQVSIELGCQGPVLAVSSACASGNNAIGDAFELIKRGAADAMLAGGAEATVTPVGISSFAAMRALSERNDEPEKASRPFDRDRDGFVMGEGAAILVLEELERAQARGARIYAEISGYGMSADAYHISAPEPTGRNAARAIGIALAEAGLQPGDVDYINAHGTSTPLGDEIETRVIRIALDAHADKVAISSTKSMTGHCLGAAGALEAVACVMTIDQGLIPPTINLDNPCPECDLDYVPNQAREREVKVAISNSFGFGGHNVTILFRAPRAV